MPRVQSTVKKFMTAFEIRLSVVVSYTTGQYYRDLNNYNQSLI